ncbi:rhodanese-like domain-containing protein [uncultured Desulfuromonas sp.]|uniref:rhodanese-like domain-containing protein n=1 Tax=uncultured Desulfuromonas sp. TaxID=181013 RepID=UPI00261E8E5B|nr:rhodanese-like domain-containing protein [uncultured Desulfuromonas sp.]
MKAKELAKKIKSKQPPTVVDVRSGFEFRSGHVPGALHAPTWRIVLRLAGLPKDKEAAVVVTCEHGPRAQLAKSLLGLAGYRNLDLLEGHMARWRRAGLPVEK